MAPSPAAQGDFRWRTRLLVAAPLAVFVTVIGLAVLRAAEPSYDFLEDSSGQAFTLDSLAVEPTSATLSARVDGLDMITEAYVHYGQTTRYDGCSRVQRVPDDGERVRVELPLGPLRAGTTYHYRFVVLGGHGTVYDATGDLTFTTPLGAGRRDINLEGEDNGGRPPLPGECL